jgi:hypothetical protein
MKREYVVIDKDGNVSWSATKAAAEKFSTWKAAKKRAEELAASEPGEPVKIYELTAETIVPLKPVETARKQSIEH